MSNERKLTESLLHALLTATTPQKAAALAALRAAPPARAAKTAAPGPLLLGPSKAAQLLGVSRSSLWRMIRTGRLPTVEILPGCRRVRRTDVEAVASGATP